MFSSSDKKELGRSLTYLQFLKESFRLRSVLSSFSDSESSWKQHKHLSCDEIMVVTRNVSMLHWSSCYIVKKGKI